MGVFGATDQLRKVAGAADGSTSSEIMFSGGAVQAAMDTIDPSTAVPKTGEEALSSAKRMLESGATDAPGDILQKVRTGTDPNPGHTEPATTSSADADPAPTPTPTPTATAASKPFGDALATVGNLSDTKLAGIAAAGVAVAVIGGK